MGRGPIVGIVIYWRPYWGSPIYRNYRIGQGFRRFRVGLSMSLGFGFRDEVLRVEAYRFMAWGLANFWQRGCLKTRGVAICKVIMGASRADYLRDCLRNSKFLALLVVQDCDMASLLEGLWSFLSPGVASESLRRSPVKLP